MKRPSLNHIYRLVWSERLNAWVAVAENVRTRGRRASRALTLSVLLALGLAPAAHALDDLALPANGQIVAGQGSIGQLGNTLTVNQNSNRLVAQWDSFNIGKNAGVVFNQPGADSVALNRIGGISPSEILGSLSANGQVYLVNPSGIVFGRSAQVNVGALVASSLNLSNEDFLAGNLRFSGSNASGAIVNQGSISAPGGVVALLAPQVTNQGTISAANGSVLLAAGQGVSLDFVGDGLISYNIDAGTARALVDNGGMIAADGGLAVLSAKAADAVNQAVVNNTGTVRARTLAEREGRILLLSDMEHGTTTNSGTLDASATGSGNGGFIETSAANVKIGATAVIDTRAANGATGLWLLDPSDITIAASGGTMTGAELAAHLETTNMAFDTNGGVGGNGDIFINDDVITSPNSNGRTLTLIANRDININAQITATGNPLSVVLNASRDVSFSSAGRVSTNGGNFVVGVAPTAIGSMATASGVNFSMAGGSYVSVGYGSLDINVSGTIQLAANSLRASGNTYRILNDGTADYIHSSYQRLLAGTGISTINTDAAVADITGPTHVTLESAAIGSALAPIKIGRNSFGQSLSLVNLAGDSYVNVLNASTLQGFGTVSVAIGNQANSTQRVLLGGDVAGHGHISMNTNGAGLLALQDDDIDTAGTGSNIAISANDITFASNSVDVGSRSFTASATTLYGSGNDSIADVRGGALSFSGIQLGSSSRRLEVAGGALGANSLSFTNGGGDTYARSIDDSFLSVSLTNAKAAGTHSVLFATDHIDYTTDGAGILLPALSASSGADVRAGNRFLSFAASSGNIRFETDSVNTGRGTLQAVISGGNSDGTSGDVIRAVNAKDGAAEITTGNAQFYIYSGGSGRITDIELAKGVGAGSNNLTVYTHAGSVDLTELDPHHFKALNLTLNGAHVNGQAVRIDLNGSDDVSLTDGASRLVLDSTRLQLTDFNRSWQLSAASRNVQIDSVGLGSGSYYVHGSNLYLNSNVLTDGGNITLNAGNGGGNLYLGDTVRIDSNADDVANATSTGASGAITLYGNVSSAGGPGRTLTVDSSSTTQGGGAIYWNGNAGSAGGNYLSGLSFTSKGSLDTNDAMINLGGGSFLLDGSFSSIGYTNFFNAWLDVVIDTEQGGDGDAGNIAFGGMGLAGSQYSGYTFNASTTGAGRNGGNVDLDTLYHQTFNAKNVAVSTLGGVGGTNGNIDLPAVSTAGTNYNGTTTNQAYTGNIITLHGNLSTNGGNVTLMGDTRLAESVIIRTSVFNPTTAAGQVTFAGTGVSATAPGKDLTINTSTTASNAYNAGTVTFRGGTAGGAAINNLSIVTRAFGSGGNSADINLLTDVTTGGDQAYSGLNVWVGGAMDALGNISIDTASNSNLVSLQRITANSLLLQGGAFSFTGMTNQVGTLAAQGGAVSFANSGALTIGSVGGVSGITSTGRVTVGTYSGDLTLANGVSSADTSNSAIVLAAGLNTSAGTAAGGNVLVGNGVSVASGGRATIYSGSVDGSTGLTQLVGYGSGRFRYNSDEVSSGFTKALGTGVYAIYREAPTISVSANNLTTVYGSIPTLAATIVDGRNGDASTNFTFSIGDGDAGTADGALSSSGRYIVGTHTITATSSAGAAELGYNVSGGAAGVLTVTPKELTVSGFTASRVYDGTTNATVDSSGASASGLIGGDSVTQDYSGATGAFSDKNAGTGKALTVGGVTLSGADAANYVVRGSGTGDISARVLTVGYTGVTRTYDGTTAATVVSSDDRIGNDVLSIGTQASFRDKNAGTGKGIDVSNATLSGADAGNYVLASTTGTATGSIAPRTLNVSFIGTDRVYDGTTGTTVTSSDDRVAGDVLSISQQASFGDKNAGADKAVNVSDVAVSGTDAGNYVLASSTGSTTANIARRTLTLGYAGVDKTFDGTAVARVATTDDRLEGDDLSFDVTARFADRTVGENRSVSIQGVKLGGADAGNYEIANPTGSTTASIEPGGVSDNILASITSAQSSLNGTSTAALAGSTTAAIGAGAGSATLMQNASPIVSDGRVLVLDAPFSLNGANGSSALNVSRSAGTSTLTISDAPAKPAQRSALPVFEARNSNVQFSGAFDVVDGGSSISLSATTGASPAVPGLGEISGPTAAGSIRLADGREIGVQAGLLPGSILLVTLPADAPDMDVDHVALVSLVLAGRELQVTPEQLKGLIVRKR